MAKKKHRITKGLKTYRCVGGHWAKRGRKTVCAGGRRVKK